MHRIPRSGLLAGAATVLLVAGVVAAWAISTGSEDDEVARNVTLAGRKIGGMSQPELEAVVSEISGQFAAAPVRITAPEGGFTTDTATLGMTLVPADTIRSAMRAGRTGTLPSRVWGWLLSFARPRQAPMRIAVRPASVYRVVPEEDPGPRKAPKEPSVKFEKGAFVPVPGEPGRGIDPADVIAQLPEAVSQGFPIVVRVDRGEIAPRNSIVEARRLAGEASAKVTEGLDVRAGDDEETVPLATLRSWVTTDVDDRGDLFLTIDREKALTDVAELLPEAGEEPKDTGFEVVGGEVRIVPGEPGTECCRDTAADALGRALLSPGRGALVLPLKEVPPQTTVEEANALGIKEQVATFETKHPSGQPRVGNIHRIADIVRGQVIEPGETFSVNEFVGRRTAEKGFVSAPVIEEGRFTEDVGGGVSQFATTFFNAAFLAGLDLVEYQSHSIYISRYPYGREATLSFPKPDLRIRNSTPYGVLIWPTYTGSSIRVSLYSTKHVTVEQTGQTRGPRGNCTRVRTERTRTYPDGTVDVDEVFAVYRPEEGVNC